MSTPIDPEYAQFLAFKAQQQQAATPAPEQPTLTIVDVLKALVNNIGLPSETLVHEYHRIIDAWHAAQTAVEDVTGKGDNAA